MLISIIIVLILAALAARFWRFVRDHVFLIIIILAATGALGGLKLYHDGVIDLSALLSRAGFRKTDNMQISLDRDVFDRLNVREDARIRVYVKDILQDGDLTQLIIDLPDIGEQAVQAVAGSRAFEKGREYYLLIENEVAPALGEKIMAGMQLIQQEVEEIDWAGLTGGPAN